MNEPIKFMTDYCDFTSPNHVWIMKGVARNKDNEGKIAKFFHRMVVTNTEDIETCYNHIHLLANNPEVTYRIYISLNSRDVFKGFFKFQKKMIDIGMGLASNLDDHLAMSKKVGSYWKTELEQSSCRGTKRFLLDIDDQEEKPHDLGNYIDYTIGSRVYCLRKTVSGWALVFNACDTRKLMVYCQDKGYTVDLQRDSMVFVEAFNG